MIPRRHWLSFKPVAHSFHVVDTQKIAFTLKCGRGHSPVTMASSSDTYPHSPFSRVLFSLQSCDYPSYTAQLSSTPPNPGEYGLT